VKPSGGAARTLGAAAGGAPRLLLAALAVLVAGCTMGPDYVRPTIDAPKAFRFEPAKVAETANTAWWKLYGDPVLDQLIDTALANNLNVKVAAANVEQALGVITQTRSGLFPQVGYSASGERARLPVTRNVPSEVGVPNPQTTYQALLTARSTSGGASAACPRPRWRTCSRPTRRAAA
jgi:multidrug efflux system outer membrane protein